jgi:beta-glucosidase/6-phospho-beta-glucosidase/beta-galactosidase
LIWLYIMPSGMRSLTNYVKDRYNSPPVYITENDKNTYKTDPDPLPFPGKAEAHSDL